MLFSLFHQSPMSQKLVSLPPSAMPVQVGTLGSLTTECLLTCRVITVLVWLQLIAQAVSRAVTQLHLWPHWNCIEPHNYLQSLAALLPIVHLIWILLSIKFQTEMLRLVVKWLLILLFVVWVQFYSTLSGAKRVDSHSLIFNSSSYTLNTNKMLWVHVLVTFFVPTAHPLQRFQMKLREPQSRFFCDFWFLRLISAPSLSPSSHILEVPVLFFFCWAVYILESLCVNTQC